MSRRFWREQRVAALIAVTGGMFFWVGYGLIKGTLFSLAIILILQVPIVIEYLKNRSP